MTYLGQDDWVEAETHASTNPRRIWDFKTIEDHKTNKD